MPALAQTKPWWVSAISSAAAPADDPAALAQHQLDVPRRRRPRPPARARGPTARRRPGRRRAPRSWPTALCGHHHTSPSASGGAAASDQRRQVGALARSRPRPAPAGRLMLTPGPRRERGRGQPRRPSWSRITVRRRPRPQALASIAGASAGVGGVDHERARDAPVDAGPRRRRAGSWPSEPSIAAAGPRSAAPATIGLTATRRSRARGERVADAGHGQDRLDRDQRVGRGDHDGLGAGDRLEHAGRRPGRLGALEAQPEHGVGVAAADVVRLEVELAVGRRRPSSAAGRRCPAASRGPRPSARASRGRRRPSGSPAAQPLGAGQVQPEVEVAEPEPGVAPSERGRLERAVVSPSHAPAPGLVDPARRACRARCRGRARPCRPYISRSSPTLPTTRRPRAARLDQPCRKRAPPTPPARTTTRGVTRRPPRRSTGRPSPRPACPNRCRCPGWPARRARGRARGRARRAHRRPRSGSTPSA